MEGQQFTNEFGTGRVNAYKALKLILSPNQIVRLGPYTGGTVASTKQFNARLFGVQGLSNGLYRVKRYEVIRDIQFPQSMNPPSVAGLNFDFPQAWGNGTATPEASTGLPYTDGDCPVCCSGPNIYGIPHTEVVPGTVTNTGCRLRTYVYEVWRTYYLSGVCVSSTYLGYFPTTPSNVQMAATVLGIPSSQPNLTSADSVGLLTTIENPEAFFVEQNYPNPFNPSTTLRYHLPEDTEVTLTIYNLLGQKVRTLVQGRKAAGVHTVRWDGTNDAGALVASGTYLVRLAAGEFVGVQKVAFVK